MDTRILKSWLAAGGALLALGGVARAGGFDRGGVNIDLLFDDRPYAVEAGVTRPSRRSESCGQCRLASGRLRAVFIHRGPMPTTLSHASG